MLLWTRFWLALAAFVWLSATMYDLQGQWASFIGLGPATLRVLLPYLVSSSLLLACWSLADRATVAGEKTGPVLIVLWPVLVALCVVFNPAHSLLLAGLPLLAAVGLSPQAVACRIGQGPSRSWPWNEAMASVVEGAALQAVAWGAIVSVLSFFLEFVGRGALSALFVAFGTGFGAWLFSGLLWGLAQYLRRERSSL